jgi:hypothetical protein
VLLPRSRLCPWFWTLGEPLGSKQVSALVHERCTA